MSKDLQGWGVDFLVFWGFWVFLGLFLGFLGFGSGTPKFGYPNFGSNSEKI